MCSVMCMCTSLVECSCCVLYCMLSTLQGVISTIVVSGWGGRRNCQGEVGRRRLTVGSRGACRSNKGRCLTE